MEVTPVASKNYGYSTRSSCSFKRMPDEWFGLYKLVLFINDQAFPQVESLIHRIFRSVTLSLREV